MNILILGANGYLGSKMVHAFFHPPIKCMGT